MDNVLRGTGVALVTPFNEDLTIDFSALEKLIEFNISGGVDFFVLLGTTAETATLSDDEKKSIIDFVIKINNNRLPLVLGLGGNNTQEVVNKIKTTDLSDFYGILSVCPYYNKPNQEGIYQHYKAIATATEKPIILYNVPGRTVVNMSVSTTLRLANDFKNIVAVKEAAPSFVQTLEILKDKPSDFLVLSGDDDLANSQVLAGASGVVSVLAQAFPSEFSSMINYALDNNAQESYKIFYKLMNMGILIFEEGSPAGIKSALNELGIVKPYVRLPLVPVSEDLNQRIKNEVKKISA
ncbi:MAG: 4-hydroxy-tetrahydrodipicolinate synthase [Flavobacteriales bacterium]|nr:4-hydroxy-tetrahydrodipicolinate synthase [Flavobacteriales bacterium]